ncbi:hypothetical protein SM995_13955 [Escherichia coli]|nr:hypothetical protein [Escherichia coli]
MLKQQDMTETAAAVLHFLPADKWVTPRMMTRALLQIVGGDKLIIPFC